MTTFLKISGVLVKMVFFFPTLYFFRPPSEIECVCLGLKLFQGKKQMPKTLCFFFATQKKKKNSAKSSVCVCAHQTFPRKKKNDPFDCTFREKCHGYFFRSHAQYKIKKHQTSCNFSPRITKKLSTDKRFSLQNVVCTIIKHYPNI